MRARVLRARLAPGVVGRLRRSSRTAPEIKPEYGLHVPLMEIGFRQAEFTNLHNL
jgi:hypothetical protein